MKTISRRALFGLLVPASLAQVYPYGPTPEPAPAPSNADLAAMITLIQAAVTGLRVRVEVLESCYSNCHIIEEREGKV